MAQMSDTLHLRSDPQSYVFVAQNPNDSPKKASVYSQARRDTERKKRQRAINVLKTSKPLPVKHFLAREQQSSLPKDSPDFAEANNNSGYWSPRGIAIDWSLPHSLNTNALSLECRTNLACPTLANLITESPTNVQIDSLGQQYNGTELQRKGQSHRFCELPNNIPHPLSDIPQTVNCDYTLSAHYNNDLRGELSSTEELCAQNSHHYMYDMLGSSWIDLNWSGGSLYYSQQSNDDIEELEPSIEEIEWVQFGSI